MIIFGTRYYGKVDEVPGLFHVATRFLHIWFIPLIPLGSILILAKSGNSIHGAKIPLSFKSILIAWLRAAVLAAAFSAAFASIYTFANAKDWAANPHQKPAQTTGPIGVPPRQPGASQAPSSQQDLIGVYIVASVEAALGVVFAALAFALWKLAFFRRASYARALVLADHIKITDEGRIMIERAYGRLLPEQAQAALSQALKDREELAALEQEPEAAS